MHADKTPTLCVHIPKVSPFLYHFFLSFSVHWGVPSITVGLVWEACCMMNPYLVRKFTLPFPTKITRVCWCDNLEKQDHTHTWGQTGATASLPIPHFSLMSTCIHSKKTPECKLSKKDFQYMALSETNTIFFNHFILLLWSILVI